MKKTLTFASALLLWSTIAMADTEPHPTPDIPRPGYLEPFVDPTFGSTIIRVSDAGEHIINPNGDPSLNGRDWGDETGHGYSSRVAWNADQSLLAMDKGVSGFVMLDGETYQPLFRISVRGARWHPTDPDTMLYVNNKTDCVGEYHVRDAKKIWEKCFEGFRVLDWADPGKSKPSLDGNVLPLKIQRSSDGHWLATLYYIDTDTLLNPIDMMAFVDPGSSPEFIMSPLADTIIINGCITGHLSSRCSAQLGLDVATRTELWRELKRHNPGHADELLDADGEQWRIGLNKSDPKGIYARNFRTGEERELTSSYGPHTSARAIHGRAISVTSFHGSGDPYINEVVGFCVDGSCIERYAHTHRASDGRYLNETQASVSPFGNKIVFRSNWDDSGGLIDAYVIEIADVTPPDPGPGPDPTPPDDALLEIIEQQKARIEELEGEVVVLKAALLEASAENLKLVNELIWVEDELQRILEALQQ